MRITKSQIAVIGLVLVSFAVSIYFYPRMPERIASHWNARGEVDGYMNKNAGLFIMPCVMAGMALILYIIPYLDPLRRNIEKFRPYYEGFIVYMCIFMLSAQYHTILWNLGIRISVNLIMPVGIGLLFFYCGILCKRAKLNWFIGIRTPWTLSSDRVWEKTHNIGGKLFKISGIIALAGAIFQKYAIFFIVVPAISVAVFTIVYSFVIYQQEKAG